MQDDKNKVRSLSRLAIAARQAAAIAAIPEIDCGSNIDPVGYCQEAVRYVREMSGWTTSFKEANAMLVGSDKKYVACRELELRLKSSEEQRRTLDRRTVDEVLMSEAWPGAEYWCNGAGDCANLPVGQHRHSVPVIVVLSGDVKLTGSDGVNTGTQFYTIKSGTRVAVHYRPSRTGSGVGRWSAMVEVLP